MYNESYIAKLQVCHHFLSDETADYYSDKSWQNTEALNFQMQITCGKHTLNLR
jgi:hypothetical protein